MSRHTIQGPTSDFVVGWDQPLRTFFLQEWTKGTVDQGGNAIRRCGTGTTELYEVENLTQQARRWGCTVPPGLRKVLYLDKDEGR